MAKQQKDAKHRMYVLDQWLKTEINYNQDIKASIDLIKPKMIEYKLIDQQKANKLFPYFQEMLKISDAMIEVISSFKRESIMEVMIGEKLYKIVSYYKIYLEYFKHKTEIKALYEELEKIFAKELRNIESDLRGYFVDIYQQKAIMRSKFIQQQITQSEKPAIANPKANITIHDCLERPLYRLFKYHLLIDSYLKKLSSKHPDYNPLKRAKQLFVEIGQKCNVSFTQQQNQDFKHKVQLLYGQSIPNSTKYKTMMSAQTLYFPCKLYIFNNLIILSKAEKMIGFRQQKLYSKIGIDEFSFISYKKDSKYFKNILILCGIYECIHFFLPDKGTRLEIYNLVSKIVHEQKFKAFRQRQHFKIGQGEKIKWLTQESSTSWLTGIKLEVIDIDVRELGMFSTDTAFIVSVSIPEYIDDEATFLKTNRVKEESNQSLSQYTNNSNHYGNYIPKNQRQSLTKEQMIITSRIGPVQYKKFESESEFIKTSNYSPLNQHLEIHLSDLIQLYKDLRERYPEIHLPQIDPISKDFNFYTENKKKTKSFEVRSFLIEEFFNFVFRHPIIMMNPLPIVSKLRMDEYMWDYVVARSLYLQNDKRDDSLTTGQTPGNKYDQNHCKMCQQSVIDNINKFQLIREKMIRTNQRKIENYCFNFYNLLRNNLLGLPSSQFNSVEKMLLYMQYFEGRIDYSFLYKKNLSRVHKVVSICIPKVLSQEERSAGMPIFQTLLQISIDHKTTVGMVVNSIAKDTQVFNMFDYRLVIYFNGIERILDQDQFLYDVVDKYQVKCEQKKISENDSQVVGPRNSYHESTFMKSTMGVFSYIKNLLPTINKNESIFYLKKMVYFPMYFELQSMRGNFQRSKLLVAEVLDKISKTTSSIPFEVWGELCGLYYCISTSKQLISTRASINTDSPAVYKACMDLLPEDKLQLAKAKIFTQKMQSTINQRKKYIMNLNNQTQANFLSSIHQRVIELGYKHFKVNTCFTQVEAKRVPNILVMDEGLILAGNCYIGVNHTEIVVVRDRRNMLVETIRMPLEDVEIVHSVYSLFLSYRREDFEQNAKNAFSKQAQSKIDEFELRFDSKMLHGFVQLCEKYKLLKNKFGPMLIEYENMVN